MTLPRFYSDILLSKPQQYYDYQNLQLTWGSQQNYQITRKLGRGKYSEVFQGVNLSNSQRVVIKILKPIHKRKIKREMKVLKILQNSPQIPRLLDTVRDRPSRTPSLILSYFQSIDFKVLFPRLTDFQLRFYTYELLKVLDFAHSHGIMHRDVKPNNLMIDHQNRELRLIDWGLAQFYIPNTPYNVRVASRYYKAPELLVNNQLYDYSLDLWSAGAVFAGMVFKKEPFFHGHDNLDMLMKIARVLGSEALQQYLQKYQLEVAHELQSLLGVLPPKSLQKFVTPENRELAVPEAIDLISKLLVYDHSERLMAKEAMEHEYFQPVREMWQQVDARSISLEPDSEAFVTAQILLNKV